MTRIAHHIFIISSREEQYSYLPHCFQITGPALPRLPQNSFQLLLCSAAPLAVHTMQLVLSWEQGWSTVWMGPGLKPALVPSSRLLCSEPFRILHSNSCLQGKVTPAACFIHQRPALPACMQNQEAGNSCVCDLDCNAKSLTGLERFTSPLCLTFPTCRNEIVLPFLSGILQGLIS